MDQEKDEATHDFPRFFKVYKDGRIERYQVDTLSPAGLDPNTGVQSKDVLVSAETGVEARIFIPKIDGRAHKLPLLLHFHGGGFCKGSAFDTKIKRVLTSLVAQANIIAVSIDYRLAPEHPLPIAYDDSWVGFQWIATHSNGLGPDPWLNEYADFGRVFLGGESAGANIAHYVAVQAGINPLAGLKVIGLLIVHPFFVGKETDKMYKFMCPTSRGRDDDPKLNPAVDPNLTKMVGERVLICVAEKDELKDRGEAYYTTLVSCGWGGRVEFFETRGEGHVFHKSIYNENTILLEKKMVDFIKE